ncbi:MAG: nicotinate-nucleotide adenylyltransferase [Nitrospiraceae bacterium]|nr:nicotinate-nucleotide adenylyltransferase [Nitrospiraceae bacterium]
MTQKIGILGGTFNPIHVGHLAAAEEVCDRLGLDRILFIPTFLPPHKKERDVPAARERAEMVRLAISGNRRFSLDDREIRRGGTSYTIDTIRELRRELPDAEFYFITGLDSFLDIRTWKDWRNLLEECVFAVLSREGSRFRELERLGITAPAPDDLEALDRRMRDRVTLRSDAAKLELVTIPCLEISSTDIRNRISKGKSAKYLLPEAVETYIIEHKFYG